MVSNIIRSRPPVSAREFWIESLELHTDVAGTNGGHAHLRDDALRPRQITSARSMLMNRRRLAGPTRPSAKLLLEECSHMAWRNNSKIKDFAFYATAVAVCLLCLWILGCLDREMTKSIPNPDWF